MEKILSNDDAKMDSPQQKRDDLKLLDCNLKLFSKSHAESGSKEIGHKQPDLNDNTYTRRRKGTKRRLSSNGTVSSDEEESEPRHTVKLSSVLVRSSEVDRNEEKRRAILESQRNNKQVFDRNRRMFGMLIGTLKQFQNEETGRERLTVKRTKVEEKLELAVEEEKANDTKEVDRISEQKLQEEEQLDKDELKLDVMDRFKKWERTHRQLCGYIQTDAKPKLLWLPKELDPITERKLKETRDYFSVCIAEKTAKLKKELDELENESKKVVANSKESTSGKRLELESNAYSSPSNSEQE